MKRNQSLISLIRQLIEREDRILKVRGGRGYGVGHPILFKGKVSDSLGKQEEKQQKVQQDKQPVKISKAFKNKKRNK